MKHEMKLQPKYFKYILNGTKRIEIRLNDEKRQLINKKFNLNISVETTLNDIDLDFKGDVQNSKGVEFIDE